MESWSEAGMVRPCSCSHAHCLSLVFSRGPNYKDLNFAYGKCGSHSQWLIVGWDMTARKWQQLWLSSNWANFLTASPLYSFLALWKILINKWEHNIPVWTLRAVPFDPPCQLWVLSYDFVFVHWILRVLQPSQWCSLSPWRISCLWSMSHPCLNPVATHN